jgi:hypothetical protein
MAVGLHDCGAMRTRGDESEPWRGRDLESYKQTKAPNMNNMG